MNELLILTQPVKKDGSNKTKLIKKTFQRVFRLEPVNLDLKNWFHSFDVDNCAAKRKGSACVCEWVCVRVRVLAGETELLSRREREDFNPLAIKRFLSFLLSLLKQVKMELF